MGMGGLLPAQHHPVQQVVDALKRAGAAVDLQVVDGSQRMKVESSPAKPEDVIQVSVGDEDAVEALEAHARIAGSGAACPRRNPPGSGTRRAAPGRRAGCVWGRGLRRRYRGR